MFCEHCGKSMPDDARFCENCGAAITGGNQSSVMPEAQESVPRAVTPSGEILLGSDGVYRWAYDLNLFTNPTILLLIWKIFAFIGLGLFAFLVLLSMGDHNFWSEGFLELARGFGLLLIGIMALALVGYLLYTIIMGGKYCVLFEMDEDGVKHIALPKQFKKAQVMGMLTSFAGAAGGRIGTIGTGLLAASKNSSFSYFKVVRSVECCHRRNVIKVNELLSKNQVYCVDADFEFVRDYIVTRCVNAKKIKG